MSLLIEKSAPSPSGRVPSTVAVVLSTATRAPAACATAVAAARSQTSSQGLLGDSSSTSRAPATSGPVSGRAVGTSRTRTSIGDSRWWTNARAR